MDLSSFVRRDISGIRKDILPLSGFGILSHALADEIASRNQTREGYFYTTDMEFLEEAEPEQPPVLPPRPRAPETIRMDMTLLFKLVQENPESGKKLPVGTQKMLERVRTILKTSPQNRVRTAPQTVRRVPIPTMPDAQSNSQSNRMMPMVQRLSAPQYLPQNRMQNPLRDPKTPLAVEKMRTPSREVPRASDHAMLFSDVLHRAQTSGLTFAARQGQGGLPASAQTRTAYITQALRKAKAEQQAAEGQSTPVWQRTMQKEASQTPQNVSGASWWFDGTNEKQQKTDEITTNDILGGVEPSRTVPAQKAPENAASVLQQMTAPRYPETELNFAQEEAPTEGAEMPIPAIQHPSAESIRAVQEASAKALTETVRAALKEAVPLMTETEQQKVQKQEVRREQPERTAQKNQEPPSDTAQGRVVPQMRQITRPQTQHENARQTARSIPPQVDGTVENRPEKSRNAVDANTLSVPESTQMQSMETGYGEMSRNAEKNAEKISEGTAEREATPVVRMDEATEHPETVQQHSADPVEQKSAPQETAKIPVQKAEMQNGKTAEIPNAISENTEQADILKRLVETAPAQSEILQQDAEAMREYPQNMEKKAEAETAGERIPALSGDRTFAEGAENAASVLQQMTAPRYPETELDFVQEEAPTEGAEMPIPAIQHPSAESIRAVQEASAKALTETVRAALKEAAPLMTETEQQKPQKQAERSERLEQTAQKNQEPPSDTAQSRTVPQMRQTARPQTQHESTRQTSRSIPLQVDGAVENQQEKVLSGEQEGTPVIRTQRAKVYPETVEQQSARKETAETLVQKAAEQSRETAETRKVISENTEQASTLESSVNAVPVQSEALQQGTETIPEYPQNMEKKAEAETAGERIPALSGDRTFAEGAENAASVLQQMTAPRYPETELDFVQEEAPTEGAEMPIPAIQHPSAESIRAVQEASAKALTETVRAALKEAAPLMTETEQQRMQKKTEQVVRETMAAALDETAAQNRLPQKAEEALHKSFDATLKQSVPEMRRTVQAQEKEQLREWDQTLQQETAKAVQKTVSEIRSETADALQKGITRRSELRAVQKNETLRNMPDELYLDAVEETEGRLPPLSEGQTLPGQTAGGTDGMEHAVKLLRQNGYGAAPLEYRMEDAAPETAMGAEVSRQTGMAAEKSLLWLGEKVAANAARELSRMQRVMPHQQNASAQAGQMGQQSRFGQSGSAGSTVYTAGTANAKNVIPAENNTVPYTAGGMKVQPIHTASRPMKIPAEAQWKPGGQNAPAQMVSPAEMPHLMYQTGQSEGTEVPFVPAGSMPRALPQMGNSMEAQTAYPALSMEYSSPMSRMEQQLQSAMAQQMSAASRPMAMQTEAGQYMAGKAAPGGMTTLDQMSAPPINDQIVWQNPYLRSAPADMTYRSKKKQTAEQLQPAPRPQTVRMSDAEIHRMADQVFRIVKDKIRQERRKMGL